MKKSVLLLFVAFATTFSSCKKGGDPEKEPESSGAIITPGGKSCLLTKLSEEDYYEIFEYDDQKRVVKIKYYEDNIMEGYTTVSYSASQIIVREFEGNSTQVDETTTYTVSNGVVTGSSETYTYSSIGAEYTSVNTYTYEHNSEGYLTKKTRVRTSNNPQETTRTETTTYTYQNGNLMKEVYTSGDQTFTTTFEYDTTIANTIYVDDEAILLSKPNKNAVKKETGISSNPGSTANVTTYTYELDADKLITKQTQTEVYGNETYTDVSIYNYTCN